MLHVGDGQCLPYEYRSHPVEKETEAQRLSNAQNYTHSKSVSQRSESHLSDAEIGTILPL